MIRPPRPPCLTLASRRFHATRSTLGLGHHCGGPVPGTCLTLRLTPEQRAAVLKATGVDGDALVLPVADLETRVADASDTLGPDEEALVWECLNPYP
jgi:hypothetical protein